MESLVKSGVESTNRLGPRDELIWREGVLRALLEGGKEANCGLLPVLHRTISNDYEGYYDQNAYVIKSHLII